MKIKQKRLMAVLFCILLPACASFDMSRISASLHEKSMEAGIQESYGIHVNDIGLHFGLGGFKPKCIVCLNSAWARFNFYIPPFMSLSFGKIGNKGFQLYGGIKYDPTEDDYLFSGAARRHLLSEPAWNNQGGS